MHRRSLLRAALALVAGTGITAGAHAQGYPAQGKQIRFIVPYPPGGGTDIVARLIAPKIAESLGTRVVVENRPGASTILGTEMLAKAPPDGYTIGLVTDSHAINPSFFQKLPYDSVRDFEPISRLVSVPLVLVANPSLGVKSVPELIAAARAKPGAIRYASIGNGTPHQLAMEWLRSLGKFELTHVPHKGVAPALNDVVGGHIDVMFTGLSSGLPHVRAGRLNGLAVSTAQRQPAAADIPSVAESGLPEFDFLTWYGLAAPAGVPREIIERLSREVARALEQPDVKERLATLGVVGTPSTPQEFGTFMAGETRKLEQIIRATGIKGE